MPSIAALPADQMLLELLADPVHRQAPTIALSLSSTSCVNQEPLDPRGESRRCEAMRSPRHSASRARSSNQAPLVSPSDRSADAYTPALHHGWGRHKPTDTSRCLLELTWSLISQSRDGGGARYTGGGRQTRSMSMNSSHLSQMRCAALRLAGMYSSIPTGAGARFADGSRRTRRRTARQATPPPTAIRS